MSVFSWLTLKFIIIWHGVAQPRFLGIQEAGSREGQPQPVWWLIKSIVPTSDWLQFWGLFKIFFFLMLIVHFFCGGASWWLWLIQCVFDHHPAVSMSSPKRLFIACGRRSSRYTRAVLNPWTTRGWNRLSAKVTNPWNHWLYFATWNKLNKNNFTRRWNRYHLDKMSGEVGNAAKQQNYIHVWVLRQFFADLQFKANILGGR